mgnify:CR=1 FL=1
MDWSVFFDFLGAGGGLMVLLKWLSDLPFVRLRLKGEGEDAFRDIERRMLREVAAFEDVLVSTGGGAPCFFDNMEFMNGAGQTVYLKVSVEELAKRLELCKSTRPILEGRSGDELRAFIAESLEKREPFYSKASIVFDAEEMMTDQDVYKISQELATRL